MGPRGQLSVIAFAVASSIATPVLGDPAASGGARELVHRGVELYERGEIDRSIEVLEQAHAIEVTAEGCYALGQALRKQGACARAIPFYRCAVERAPSEAFSRAANYQIGRCVVESGLQPEPTVVVPAPPPVPPPAPAPRPRWYRDPAGGILLGLGLGAAGVGGGLLVHAELRAGDARDDLEAFRAADGVGTERLVGAASLSVGGVLLLGSIVRYVLVNRR